MVSYGPQGECAVENRPGQAGSLRRKWCPCCNYTRLSRHSVPRSYMISWPILHLPGLTPPGNCHQFTDWQLPCPAGVYTDIYKLRPWIDASEAAVGLLMRLQPASDAAAAWTQTRERQWWSASGVDHGNEACRGVVKTLPCTGTEILHTGMLGSHEGHAIQLVSLNCPAVHDHLKLR